MSRLIRRSSFLVALTAAFAVGSGIAHGEQPIEQFHDHFTDSFPDVICDIPVQVDIVVTDNFFLYADDTFKDTSSFQATFTNPSKDASIVLKSAGQVTGLAIVDEAAGTVTFHTTFKGLPERIQTANGSVLLRDAGILTFADTFDLDTGEFLGSEITLIKGPHPDAESDFVLFCEVVTDALT